MGLELNPRGRERPKAAPKLHVSERTGVDPALYRLLFESCPGQFLVMTPDTTIVAVTDSYLEATSSERSAIVGKGLFDVIPHNPDDASDPCQSHLRESIDSVLASKSPDTMAVQKYSVRRPGSEDGGTEERFWSQVNVPVLGDDGEVSFVIHRVVDVTEFVCLEQAEGALGKVEKELRDKTHQMEAEVYRSAQEIQRFNRELAEANLALRASETAAQTISLELMEANRELERAKEAAESANAAKTEFLSRMSHELRTPLNSVLGFAQLLEMSYDEPKINEASRSIIRAGQHLLNLINEVLELSKIETEALTVAIEPVDLGAVIGHAIDLVRPLADTNEVRIFVTQENGGLDQVLADQQRLLQVFINLLTNAIKYNRIGGSIHVRVSTRDAERTKITVSDTGPGIGPGDRGRLFQPFQRFGDPNIEGTGLGLVLSRRFATMMGGSLDLAESSPSGTTFVLELDAVAVPAEGVAAFVREMVSPYGKSVPKGTVLYVEDNAANVRLLELVFEKWPEIELIPAMQGLLGIELAREHRPDLVLLDLHLPDVAGDKVLWRLKNDPATRSIPIVIVSADATKAQIDRLLALGADDYMTKPIDLRRLLDVMRTHLGRSK